MIDIRRLGRRPATRTAAAFLGISLFIFLLWQLPWWLDRAHLQAATPGSAAIVTGMRTTLVAVGAGTIAAVGLYYTDRNLKHSRKVLEQARRDSAKQADLTRRSIEQAEKSSATQAQIAAEQQITERYTQAIQLLSSEEPTSRLGGLYALERIMIDSEKDHATIVKVLAAFVRQQATLPIAGREGPRVPHEDVQAALSILGQRPKRDEEFTVNLSETYLRGCTLKNCNYADFDFTDAILTESSFTRVNLEDSTFMDADISDSSWDDVQLKGAYMSGIKAHEVRFYTRMDLTNCQMGHSEWNSSHFERGTIMRNTYAHMADFSGVSGLTPEAVLSAEDIENAKMPDELLRDPRVASAVLTE
ncbi:pentapeptide repeat-containing protein [Streptomyces qinglanensis]|uniref:pentapeptide repeat-containing protein n=1 Tax=Streptomyces qinglanensis TaxID=943816 RepID=UPI00378B7698